MEFRKPGGTQPLFKIEARPNEHDAVIERQGQWARVLHWQPCECIKRGKADIYCEVCGGRGETYYYQSEKDVIDENSPHYGQNVIYPYWIPISSVIKIQRKLHPVQGGNKVYTVDSFTDTEIKIGGAATPKHYEQIHCSYRYTTFDDHTQTFIYSGLKKFKIDALVDLQKQPVSNAFAVEYDIVQLVSVINETQTIDYTADAYFKKQWIYLKNNIIPNTNDKITVILKKCKPEKVATTTLKVNNLAQKWGDDIQIGDTEGLFQSNVHVKEGDLVTFLVSEHVNAINMIKTSKGWDEIPEFDVTRIIENIYDEDKNMYIRNVDFELRNYNDLVWIGNSPAAEKQYSVVFGFKLTYKVFKAMQNKITNEDKRFPSRVLLRLYNRTAAKEPRSRHELP